VRRLVGATAKPSDGPVSRWLNRPISRRVSAGLLLLMPDIRPSHVTAVVAVAGAAMFAALLFGGRAGLIAGGVLFHVASVIDGVDGEIARASHRSTVAGATLDTRVDVATNLGFFIGIAVSLTRLYGAGQAGVGALLVLFGLVGMVLLGWLARRAGRPGNLDVLKSYYRRRFPTGWQHRVTETLVAMTSRDFFAFAFGLIIVCGAGWTVSWLLFGFSAIWLTTIIAAVPGLLRQGGAPAPASAR
uniref:CDP-alcohol phosphatidyltransferase family protein n=1 Tax=Sphingomonas bacterium TaxID=1895847 RepID=UPI00157519F3